jgi:Patatin-like phospholipase
MDEFRPNTFEDVFSAELEEIAKRQEKHASPTMRNGAAVDPKELAGIALSGGGIRAATSGLGVLQALKKLGMLSAFDYLSTVSGGGFVGGWWSAWTSRNFDAQTSTEEKFFPPPELIQPERDNIMTAANKPDGKRAAPSEPISARPEQGVDPVHHLRLFSNYLTPIKGFLSADTWRANAVISRNLALTWLVLIPMIFAAVLLAQSYFTIQPHSETQFLYPYSHIQADSLEAQYIAFEMQVMGSLDSLVHGGKGAIDLPPIQKLKELGGVKHATDPYSQMIFNLGALRLADNSIAMDVGDTALALVLGTKIDVIEQRMIQWHQVDSAIRADTSLTPLARLAMLDKVRPEYRKALDPSVDSARAILTRFQATLFAHRDQMRNSWLFNEEHLDYLAHRAVWTSVFPVMMFGWIAMMICLWMINSSHKMFGGNILQGCYAFISGLVVFEGLNWLVSCIFGTAQSSAWDSIGSEGFQYLWAGVALVLLSLIVWDDAHRFWKKHRKSMNSDRTQELLKLLEIRRSRIVTFHQRLLLGAVLVAVLLIFGGFGHEAINYLFFYRPEHTGGVVQWFARFGGIATIFAALAGTGFAARNARGAAAEMAQTGRGNPKQSGKLKSTLIALAPPLILLLLLCGISWTGHWVLQALVFRDGNTVDQNYLLLVFAMWLLGFLSLYYAIFDLHFRTLRSKRKKQAKQFSRVLLFAVLLIQMSMMVALVTFPTEQYRFKSVWWGVLILVAWGIIAWKYWWEQKNPQPIASDTDAPSASSSPEAMGLQPATIGSRIKTFVMAGGSAMLILGFSLLVLMLSTIFEEAAQLPIDHLFLVGLAASVLILILDLLWGIRAPEEGRRGNHESRILLGINVTLFSLFLIIPPLAENKHWGVSHVLEVLLSLAIGLVIFVGWRIDPNSLSIHEFYRNRIVRAYLGASNWLRSRASGTQDHPEDDIALTKLMNCEHGAPYHILNTTLNLLGSKSLASAQRNASNFIFSKRYCGSVTTGYRPTSEYMSSTMTLGTAVAVSGAAASPNMGSNQVSGATTMLMSLLNIRLGYWAANPGRSRWREAQPKLWPYYLLKESLSQTTGFGAFCYLTDGGHFDNTGLYPLIERACRYIVVCDNGADPYVHYKDLGNALRRCRIDFGAEFSLDGLKEMTSLGGSSTRNDSGKAHWLRGTVRYSEAHLRSVWGDTWDEGLLPEEREHYKTGAILVLKPVLLGDEPVDVLQYGLQYADFPQQSTANQWFSEDQFESYRRLGYWSAQTAFANTDLSNASRAEQLQAIAGTART